MNVSSLIRHDVTSCTIHDNLEQAARPTWEHDIGGLPVIDDRGHPVGIISLNDIAPAASTDTVPARDVVATLAAVSAPRAIHASAP